MSLAYRKPPDRPFINVLLYGPPKSGKTTGAASAPGVRALLNCDLPNATIPAHREHGGETLREIVYEGEKTLVELGIAIEAREFDTVIVDPIGDLYRLLLDEGSRKAVRPSLNQRGDVSVQVERFCRWLCEAPVNVVLVAHELSVSNESADGNFIERLAFSGTSNTRLSRKIEGMVDVIGYCGIIERDDEEDVYAATLKPGGGRNGGDRFKTLGVWRPLNLTEWFEDIGAHMGSVNSSTTKEIAA